MNKIDLLEKYIIEISEPQISFKRNAPLSEYCSFGIGGKADIIIWPDSVKSLKLIIDYLQLNDIRYDIFGNASNVLFDDSGFSGAIIFTTKMNKVEVFPETDMIIAECGVSLTHLSNVALNNNLSGLEFAYGIPGSLGGAVFMNAGAYGGQISDVLSSSTFLSRNGNIFEIDYDCHFFDYRKSVFQNNNSIILSSVFKLNKGSYSSIKEIMLHNMSERKKKQPLEYPSAGSVFKRYPGYYTGKIIEELGLKGFSVGGAMVSEKHAGFIINYDNASAADVMKLIEIIKAKVKDKYNISIEQEILYIPN